MGFTVTFSDMQILSCNHTHPLSLPSNLSSWSPFSFPNNPPSTFKAFFCYCFVDDNVAFVCALGFLLVCFLAFPHVTLVFLYLAYFTFELV